MSRSVDERVVEMQFKNQDFERNAQQSLSTLDKLKNSLNLLGTGDALKGLGDVNTSGIDKFGNSVESVKDRFSVLETIAVGALLRIGQQAVDAGERLIKSFTVAPVSQGWDEYALKMNSVNTIMAGSGESMETVNKYLEELNEYADRTIYSFSDMTQNIGKFTNAGVGLEDAVLAIKGVSNVAAVSGANANEASRAMYNFAQALSSGSVKNIDWKSIKYANMDTKEFKEQLLETAMAIGTVVESEGKFISTTVDGNGNVSEAFTATSRWDESLKHQWLTTEVLVQTLKKYTDETTEIGKKAYDAATEIKTFSQMVDTIKESVGSSWAQIFENTFGNLEDAKKLWTGLAKELEGIFVAPVDALRDLLIEWNKFGGRLFVIEGIANIWSNIKTIFKEVGQAWKEVFPATSGQRLAEISKSFRDFTANIKISEDTLGNIKNTFKGFFALLDIGKQVISGIVGAVTPLIGKIFGLGDSLLPITGNLGQVIVQFDEWLKRNNVIQNSIQKVTGVISALFSKIDQLFKQLTGSSIGEVLQSIRNKFVTLFGDMATMFATMSSDKSMADPFGGMIASIKKSFGPLGTLLEGFKSIVSGVWGFLKKLAPMFGSVASGLGEALKAIGSGISNAVQNFDSSNLVEILKAIGSALGSVIKGFDFSNLVKIAESGLLATIAVKLYKFKDSVLECFEAIQDRLQAGTLLKIAEALAVFTVSLILLASIDPAKLTTALAAMGAEFVELNKFMGELDKTIKKGSERKLIKLAGAMIGIGAAILILSGAMKTIAKLDWDGILKGIVTIGALMLMLTKAANSLPKYTGTMTKGATGLIAFSVAIRLLVKPIKELGSLDIGSLAKGLGSLGILFLELAGFMKLANFKDFGVGDGVGLLAFAAAMIVLEKAVASFGSLDIPTLATGLISMGLALAEIGIAIKLIPNDAAVIATGMILMGTALLVIGQALKSFGSMSWEEIAKGLIVLAVALTEITVALQFMQGALAGAAAMVVVAGALALLAPVLLLLGSMSLEQIVASLSMLAGVLIVFGTASLVLAPVAPTMLSIAGALALLGAGAIAIAAALAIAGVAFLAVSAGVSLLAEALGPLSYSLLDFMNTLNENNDTILTFIRNLLGDLLITFQEFIPKLGVLLAELMIGVLKAITEHSEEIVKGLMEVLVSILSFLEEAFVPLTNTIVVLIGKLILDVADAIVNAVDVFTLAIGYINDAIMLALVTGLENILTSLLSDIPVIGDKATELVHGAAEKVSGKLREDMDKTREEMNSKGEEAGKSLTDSIGSGIEKNSGTVDNAVEGVNNNVSDKLLKSLPDTNDISKLIPKNIGEGITTAEPEATTAMESLNTDLQTQLLGHTDDYSDIGNKLFGTEEGLGLGMADGMDLTSLSADELMNYLEESMSGETEKVYTIGETMFGTEEGFGAAINDQSEPISTSFEDILDDLKTDAEDTIPEIEEIGERTVGADEGLAAGYFEKESDVVNAAEDIGDQAISAFESTISESETVGEQISEGVSRGIQNKSWLINDAARNAAVQAYNAAKAELQIQSPSKKFAWLGEQSDAGFAQGLLGAIDVIEGASKDTARSAVDAMGQALADANSLVTDSFDINPTITPVLDLSNVEDGLGTMDGMLNDQRLLTSGVGLATNTSANSQILSALNGMNAGNKTANFNIYVTGGPNANAEDVAQLVMQRINIEYQRQKAVWG